MLFLVSLAVFLSVFTISRMLLAWGTARWQEEQASRKSDALRVSPDNWKRALLGLTGRIFARFSRLPVIRKYQARLLRDNVAAANPWNMTAAEILALAELCFV